LRGGRRLTYADSRMQNLLITLLHFAVVTAKLCGPQNGLILRESLDEPDPSGLHEVVYTDYGNRPYFFMTPSIRSTGSA
jgi:hypothetical protein